MLRNGSRIKLQGLGLSPGPLFTLEFRSLQSTSVLAHAGSVGCCDVEAMTLLRTLGVIWSY